MHVPCFVGIWSCTHLEFCSILVHRENVVQIEKYDMEILDLPAELKYNNGNNFPGNFVFMGYITLVGSLWFIATGPFILGVVLLLLSLVAVTNRHFVSIDTKNGVIYDHSVSLGFVKIGKKYPLDKYKYVTTMPLIESHNLYASSSNSTTISQATVTVTFFGDRLKGKRIITKFDSKNEAEEAAMKLGERLGLKYFKYDPKLVRKIILGEITL